MYEEKEELFIGKLAAGMKLKKTKVLRDKLHALRQMLADLRSKGVNSKTLQKEISRIKKQLSKLA